MLEKILMDVQNHQVCAYIQYLRKIELINTFYFFIDVLSTAKRWAYA
jgi:hypothetical protein